MTMERHAMSQLGDLILRGMKPFFSATDAQIMQEVRRIDTAGGFLAAKEDGQPVAFALIVWPDSYLDSPQVVHFYSEGSRKATRALVGHVLDTVKKKGYTKLRAINGSALSDAAWARTFRHDGWEIKPVKTVFDFEVVK
jgi:hypothetical protein